MAKELTGFKTYGSLEIFTGVDLAIDRGSRVVVLGLNGAGKTTLLDCSQARRTADAGALEPGHGCKIGYFAREHDTYSTTTRPSGRTSATPRRIPASRTFEVCWARSCSPARNWSSRPAHCSAVRGRDWLLAGLVASTAKCCYWTSRPTTSIRPHASRSSMRCAATRCGGAGHPRSGAAEALDPQRVVLLPDGTEDFWSTEYRDLIELA